MEARTTNPSERDAGFVAAAVGGALLAVSLFLDWYGFGRGFGEEGITGWTAFEVVDILLALIALAAIYAAIGPYLGRQPARSPDTYMAPLAAMALILVVVSLVNKPPVADGTTLEAGAWLALAGAIVMCLAALLASNRVALVIAPKDRTRDPVANVGRTPPPTARTGETETHDLG